MLSKISLIISIVALAVCFIAAISGILSDGMKGLQKKENYLVLHFVFMQ
ncbi:receptor [Clostridioides difficile]